MDVAASLDAPFPPSAVFPWVAELERYPAWLDIVRAVEPDGPEAWRVDLRARLGPLSRSKRLRMALVEIVPDERFRFERREIDGREHATWVLSGTVAATDAGSTVTMSLHYGGAGLPGPVERILGHEIERGKDRLLEQVSESQQR